MRSLRFEHESDGAFRQRAERAVQIARVLVDACLSNQCMREYIARPDLPMHTEAAARENPTVRIEYEQAIAIGGIGETLAATRTKSWGDGPSLMPLEPDDWFHPHNITYVYRENSLYNRRFEQRRRLKELLGGNWRPLVEHAKRRTKTIFLAHITTEQAAAIQRILGVSSGVFWKACQGTTFLELPPRLIQRELDFGD